MRTLETLEKLRTIQAYVRQGDSPTAQRLAGELRRATSTRINGEAVTYFLAWNNGEMADGNEVLAKQKILEMVYPCNRL